MLVVGVMRVILSGMFTEDSVDVTAVLVDGIEHAKVVEKIGGGKTAPFYKGMGRVGLGAVPTTYVHLYSQINAS